MARQRSAVPTRPSPAQGNFIAQFESGYFGRGKTQDDLEREVDAARKANPKLAPRKAKKFSRSTYHSWRRQDTSPSVHDLEILCRVSGERQTLVVDPSASTEHEADDMRWLDDAQALLARLGGLSESSRGAVLARFEDAIDKELAKEAARNPQVSDVVHAGPTGVRRR